MFNTKMLFWRRRIKKWFSGGGKLFFRDNIEWFQPSTGLETSLGVLYRQGGWWLAKGECWLATPFLKCPVLFEKWPHPSDYLACLLSGRMHISIVAAQTLKGRQSESLRRKVAHCGTLHLLRLIHSFHSIITGTR